MVLPKSGRTATAPLFNSGVVLVTSNAARVFSQRVIVDALRRHMQGDWGDLDEDDIEANRHALEHGGRLLSAYIYQGAKLWVITEADRSATTLLLPEDY